MSLYVKENTIAYEIIGFLMSAECGPWAFGNSDSIDRSPVFRPSGLGKLSNSGIEVMETPGDFYITKR